MATGQASFEWWPITNEDDMFTRLKAMVPDGFRGHVRVSPTGVWDMELSAPGDLTSPVEVKAGDVLVLLGGVLQAMSIADYESRFGQ